jgi:myo-inositol-1(or 4)-monophosphatase
LHRIDGVKSLDREMQVAREAALAAGRVIARHAQEERKSWNKAEDSPVTLADLEANRAILDRIREAFPDDAVLSEETRDRGERRSAERVWIVDPLDGTKEFIARIPEFAVSVALAIGGEPVVGVVYEPENGECFAASRGSGATLNGERVQVSKASRLEDCRVIASRTEMSRGQLDRYKGWFREVQAVGSVALKLAWIAAGRADLWVSVAPKSEWDVCAGHLLVREAGGSFVTFEGGERGYNRTDVLLKPPMAAGSRLLIRAFEDRSRRC